MDSTASGKQPTQDHSRSREDLEGPTKESQYIQNKQIDSGQIRESVSSRGGLVSLREAQEHKNQAQINQRTDLQDPSFMDTNVQGHVRDSEQDNSFQDNDAGGGKGLQQDAGRVRNVSLMHRMEANDSLVKGKKRAGIMESSTESNANQQQIRHTSSIDAPFNSLRSQQQDSNFADNKTHQNQFWIQQIEQADTTLPIELQITSILKAIDQKQQNRIQNGLNFIIEELLSDDAQFLGYIHCQGSSSFQNQSEFPPVTTFSNKEYINPNKKTQEPSNIHQRNDLAQSINDNLKKETRSISNLQHRLPSQSITIANPKIYPKKSNQSNQTNVSQLAQSGLRKQNFRYFDYNQDRDAMQQPFAQPQKSSKHQKDNPWPPSVAENEIQQLKPPNNYLWTSYLISNDKLFKKSCDKPEQILEKKSQQLVQSSVIKNSNSQTQFFLGSSLRDDPGDFDLDNTPMQFSNKSKEAQIGQESFQASIAPSKGTLNNNYNEYVPDQFSFHQLNHNQESIFSQSPSHKPERSLYPFQNASETDIKVSNVTASAPVPAAHFKHKNNKYKTLKIEIKDFLDDVDAVEDIQDLDESREKNQIQTMSTNQNQQNVNPKSYPTQRSYSQHQLLLNSHQIFTQNAQQEIFSYDLQIRDPEMSRNFKANQNLILQNNQFDTNADNRGRFPTNSNLNGNQQLQRQSKDNSNRYKFKIDRKQQVRQAQERLRRRQRRQIDERDIRTSDVDSLKDRVITKLEQFIKEQATTHQHLIDYDLFQRDFGLQIQKQIQTQIQEYFNQNIKQQLKLQDQKINDIDQLFESQCLLLNKQMSELETKLMSKITGSLSAQQQQPIFQSRTQSHTSKQQQTTEQIVNYLSTMESERTREQQGFKQRVEKLINDSEVRIMKQILNNRDQKSSLSDFKIKSQPDKFDDLEQVKQELLDVLATSQSPVIQRITIFENQLIELNKLIIQLVEVQAKCQYNNQIDNKTKQLYHCNNDLDGMELEIERFSSLPKHSKSKNLLQQTYTGQLQGSNLIPIEQNQRYNQSKSMNSPSQMQLIDSDPHINNNPQALMEFQGSHMIELQYSDDIQKLSGQPNLNENRISESPKSYPASSQINRPHRLSKGSGAYQQEVRKSQRKNWLNNSKIANSLVSQNSKISNALNTSRHQASLKSSQQNNIDILLEKVSDAIQVRDSIKKLQIDALVSIPDEQIDQQKESKTPIEIKPLYQSAIKLTDVPECLPGNTEALQTNAIFEIKSKETINQGEFAQSSQIQNKQLNSNNVNDILLSKIEFKDDPKFPSQQIQISELQQNQQPDQGKSSKKLLKKSPSAMDNNISKIQNQNLIDNDIKQEDNQPQSVQLKKKTRTQEKSSNPRNQNGVLFNETESFIGDSNMSNSRSSQICSELIKKEQATKQPNNQNLILQNGLLQKQFTFQMKPQDAINRTPLEHSKALNNINECELKRRSISADFKLRPSKNSRQQTKQRLAHQVDLRRQLENQALMMDFQLKIKNLLKDNFKKLQRSDDDSETKTQVILSPKDRMPLKQRFQSLAYQKVYDHMQDHGLMGSKCPLLARAKTNLFQGLMKDKYDI